EDPAVRAGELGGDGARDGEPHGRQAVGDQQRVRLVGRVQAGHPHLHRAGGGEDDVVAAHGGPDAGHAPAARERVPVVGGALGQLVPQHPADLPAGAVDVEASVHAVGQGVQGAGDVALDADLDRVVLVDLRGELVDVDDLLVGVRVDLGGV